MVSAPSTGVWENYPSYIVMIGNNFLLLLLIEGYVRIQILVARVLLRIGHLPYKEGLVVEKILAIRKVRPVAYKRKVSG